MLSRKSKSLLALWCATLISSCAQVDKKPEVKPEQLIEEKGYVIEKEVNSIHNYRISGWNFVSDKGILLDGGVKSKYLVTFSHSCRDLRWSETLITTTTVNQLTRFDKVITRPPGGGGISNHCLIDKLYLLKKKPKADDTKQDAKPTAPEAMKI